MLQTSPRPGPRMTAGMTRAIALLALSSTAVLARLALAAVENPGLRVVPPLGEGPRRPFLDPDGLTAPQGSLISHVLGQIGQMRLNAAMLPRKADATGGPGPDGTQTGAGADAPGAPPPAGGLTGFERALLVLDTTLRVADPADLPPPRLAELRAGLARLSSLLAARYFS